MQDSIRKFSLFIVGCFVIYSLYLVYVQIWKGPALCKNSANPRPWLLEKRVVRGGIYAREGEKIAESLRLGKGFFRRYRFGPLYAHLVGYESRRLGKAGLEEIYDHELLGMRGSIVKSWEVRWGLKEVRGNDLYLTISHKMQERAWQLLAPHRGAAVVLNPQTGEILAMVSTPGFDPNPRELEENWEKLKSNPGHPLLNRAAAGLYPPGSTLKIVTAAIGVKEFPQLPGESVFCRGELEIQGGRLRDLRPHGWVDLNRALAVSCNSYFGGLGLRLGAARFAEGLRNFGWGKGVPLELPAEPIPLPEESFASASGLAEAAVGQGKIVASPLFMALVAGSLGNDGVMMKPYLVREIRSPGGEVIWRARPRVLRRTVPSPVAARVREAMVEAVARGTGRAASLPGIQVAGKTGSAENPAGSPHAWFVAFAPADRPRVAVSVLIENGGQGGRVAAPIARELMKLALF
ncbi:MAG: hypothetical protein HPY58_09095 [Firmicutes bacterium]|nr:hypothetical protein [Bacillota bacterium]